MRAVSTCQEFLGGEKFKNNSVGVEIKDVKATPNLVLLLRMFTFTITDHYIVWLISSQDFFQFASGPGVDGTLRKRAEKFKAHLTKKFRWDFDADLDDCAPVVVELPEGVTVDWDLMMECIQWNREWETGWSDSEGDQWSLVFNTKGSQSDKVLQMTTHSQFSNTSSALTVCVDGVTCGL